MANLSIIFRLKKNTYNLNFIFDFRLETDFYCDHKEANSRFETEIARVWSTGIYDVWKGELAWVFPPQTPLINYLLTKPVTLSTHLTVFILKRPRKKYI